MSSLSYLLRQLEPFVRGTALCAHRDACPERIELLCGQRTLTADRLYLGDGKAAEALSRAGLEPGVTVLLAEAGEVPPQCAGQAGCSIAWFSCSLAKLCNTVVQATAQAADWRQSFLELTDRGGGLHAIVTLTARLSSSAVLLLDQNDRVVASAGMEGSSYLSGQVSATGALPRRTCDLLFSDAPPDGGGSFAVPGTDVVLYGRRMAHLGDPFGMLLLEMDRDRTDLDAQALCACATECLRRRLLSHDLERLGSSTKIFERCWQDIIERKLTGAVEIRESLSRMPHPVEQFVRVVVVTFAGGGDGVPYNYLLARLREVFPGSNMAIHQRDVVILLSYRERTFRRDLDGSGQLASLLARYDGFAAVSNGTRNLDALGSIFQLAKRTAILAQALRSRREERVFFYEDYSMYCVIELCVKQFLECEGNEDVLYLVHPAVIHLTRYDICGMCSTIICSTTEIWSRRLPVPTCTGTR